MNAQRGRSKRLHKLLLMDHKATKVANPSVKAQVTVIAGFSDIIYRSVIPSVPNILCKMFTTFVEVVPGLKLASCL